MTHYVTLSRGMWNIRFYQVEPWAWIEMRNNVQEIDYSNYYICIIILEFGIVIYDDAQFENMVSY